MANTGLSAGPAPRRLLRSLIDGVGRPSFISSVARSRSIASHPLARPPPLTAEEEAALARRRSQEPAYLLTFTCKPCGQRSSHRVSHHGYHRGTVLIECAGCRNRHVISDHLRIFMDKAGSLEEILAARGAGEVVTKAGA
ncbi:hypothetical protein KEM52_004182, partial [Ascosphaera acerosa]